MSSSMLMSPSMEQLWLCGIRASALRMLRSSVTTPIDDNGIIIEIAAAASDVV